MYLCTSQFSLFLAKRDILVALFTGRERKATSSLAGINQDTFIVRELLSLPYLTNRRVEGGIVVFMMIFYRPCAMKISSRH